MTRKKGIVIVAKDSGALAQWASDAGRCWQNFPALYYAAMATTSIQVFKCERDLGSSYTSVRIAELHR